MSKRFNIKVYEKDGTFKKSIKENVISSGISFSMNSSGGQGSLSIDVNCDYNDTSVTETDFVKVFMVDTNFPTGKLIYTGVVDSIDREHSPSSNSIRFNLLGLWTLLAQVLYDSSGKVFTKNEDPGATMSEIVTYFNSQYPGNWLNDSGVTSLWSSLNIKYDYNTCLEAMDKLSEASGFGYFIQADWTVVFKQAGITIDHAFTQDRDIQSITIEEDSFDLVNKYYLGYDGWVSIQSDATSITNYWLKEKYESDTSIKDLTTADTRATEYISKNKNPKQTVTLELNSSVILENIAPLDIIKVRNLNYTITNASIEKIQYKTDTAILYLNAYDSIWKLITNN